jgi:hypothetical protein
MGAGTLIPNKIVFVDAANISSTEDGSFYDPYNTLQEGIDRVVAEGWNSAIIMVAPGTYVGSFQIPASAVALANLVITGWANFFTSFIGPIDLPQIGGQLLVDAPVQVSFANLAIAAQMSTSNPATDPLGLDFDHCVVTGVIVAGNVSLGFSQSVLSGQTVNGNISLSVTFDGFTWSSATSMGTNFLQAGSTLAWGRAFKDTGVTTYPGTLTVVGLAIGSMLDITIAAPGVRAGEYGILTLDDPPAAPDFQALFQYTKDDEIHVFFRNNSRVSTNFTLDVHVAVFHSFMPA